MKVVLTSLAVPPRLWAMIAPTAQLPQSAGHATATAQETLSTTAWTVFAP
ncbi:hypothetical protein [Streptomyces sp. MMBL 11-3]